MSVSRLILIVGMSLLAPAALADESAEKFLGRSAAQYASELKSASAAARHLAAWSLAQMGSTAEGALAAALADDDPAVRYWAVCGLSRIALASPADAPARQKIAAALAPLLEDKSAAPKLAAAETLARLGGREAALGVLVQALSDPQEAVRIAAIDSLARLGPLAAPAKQQIAAAASDESEYVKRISARWLATQPMGAR
jgi:HEAT repeat protein